MLSQDQIMALYEIERQIGIIRAADVPEVPDEEVILVTGNLQAAINAAPINAILDLQAQQFIQVIGIDKPLTLRNGTIQAPPNANDLVTLRGDHINLGPSLLIRGDGTTKRGINNGAMFVDIVGVEVRNIRRAGQETQAMAMWNSPGPLTVRNSIFEAGSICFLAGGSAPTIPNTIPTALTFEDCTFTRPLEWRGQGYACKNAFELKSGQDVIVRRCVIENVWSEGQAGWAIPLTASQYGNSPENVVQNVLFDNCVIRNVSGGVNLLGYGQHHATLPTRKGNGFRFTNNTFEVLKSLGGHGTLMQIGWEPESIIWQNNTIVTDGDAFIRVSDSKIIDDFIFTDNMVNRAAIYGIFGPLGSRGAGFLAQFRGGILENNILYGAHSIFRTNFPANTYFA